MAGGCQGSFSVYHVKMRVPYDALVNEGRGAELGCQNMRTQVQAMREKPLENWSEAPDTLVLHTEKEDEMTGLCVKADPNAGPRGFLEQALIDSVSDEQAGGDSWCGVPLGRWLRDEGRVPMRAAKTHLSRLAAYANSTGETITVVRNGIPWFEIRPLAADFMSTV